MASPSRVESKSKVWDLQQRLQRCWDISIDWSLYPDHVTQGCKQIGRAIDMPADAVLSGLLLLTSYSMSHCSVKVPGTVWIEPAILWIAITMPTGSGKTPLFSFLTGLLEKARNKLKLTKAHPPWLLDEASFEKMGELTSSSNSKLLGMYDELSTFLAQMNVYRGKGLCDSHDLATFLSLYTGKSWMRATVTGDANFRMEKTALTVGGFTQPSVARSLIEIPASIEKGLTQRFLWIFPKPSFSKFSTLELIDEAFESYLVDKLAHLWDESKEDVITLTIPENCKEFKDYYDCLQEKIEQISIMDELLTGMLSKAKGQVLRIAAALHILFSDSVDEEGKVSVSSVPLVISSEAVIASQNYVNTCCQHAAFIAGRGTIEDEVNNLACTGLTKESTGTAAYCLELPGKELNLSILLAAKKFRGRGNKAGALTAFEELEKAGLGELKTQESRRGTSAVYTFVKRTIDNPDEMMTKLAKFGLSIARYETALNLPEIGNQSMLVNKRSSDGVLSRQSPKKLYKISDDKEIV